VVPTVLGFDARLQFLHETDLLEVLRHATLDGVHGAFNIAGDGIVMLSQAVRRLGRPTLPVPGPALSQVGSLLRQAGVAGLSPELAGLLTFGRGVDTSRMRKVLGFRPDYTTEAAFADFARSVAPSLVPSAAGAAGSFMTGSVAGGGHA
jgi:UDP-glucose 4-epimerase